MIYMTTPEDNEVLADLSWRNNVRVERIARKIHEWYLKSIKTLRPESYNPKAAKSWNELTEEQKDIDRFMANKILGILGDIKKINPYPKDLFISKTGKAAHHAWNVAIDESISWLMEDED